MQAEPGRDDRRVTGITTAQDFQPTSAAAAAG